MTSSSGSFSHILLIEVGSNDCCAGEMQKSAASATAAAVVITASVKLYSRTAGQGCSAALPVPCGWVRETFPIQGKTWPGIISIFIGIWNQPSDIRLGGATGFYLTTGATFIGSFHNF